MATGVCESPVISCDYYPTILNQLGLAGRIAGELDGVDLSPQLHDPTLPVQRESICFHYPHYYPTTSPVSAIRKGDWKLLEFFEDSHTELYNLKNDLGETTNLAAEQPEIADQLLSDLRNWRNAVGAQLPETNPAK